MRLNIILIYFYISFLLYFPGYLFYEFQHVLLFYKLCILSKLYEEENSFVHSSF